MMGKDFKQKMRGHTTLWGLQLLMCIVGVVTLSLEKYWVGLFLCVTSVFAITGGANDSRTGLFIEPHCPGHCYNMNW